MEISAFAAAKNSHGSPILVFSVAAPVSKMHDRTWQ
jgi:hypothetical protein